MCMYCKDCGNELKENEIFCSRCGAQVEGSETKVSSKAGTGTTFKIMIIVVILLANISVVGMPFYRLLGRDTYKYNYDYSIRNTVTTNYSFVDLKGIIEEMPSYKDKVDLYNIFNWIVYSFICLNVLLLFVAILQLVNGKNWSDKGYKRITNKLVGATLINVVEIMFMLIVEIVFSENYFYVENQFKLLAGYYIIIGVVVVALFAEIGLRNALKKQEQ